MQHHRHQCNDIWYDWLNIQHSAKGNIFSFNWLWINCRERLRIWKCLTDIAPLFITKRLCFFSSLFCLSRSDQLLPISPPNLNTVYNLLQPPQRPISDFALLRWSCCLLLCAYTGSWQMDESLFHVMTWLICHFISQLIFFFFISLF